MSPQPSRPASAPSPPSAAPQADKRTGGLRQAAIVAVPLGVAVAALVYAVARLLDVTMRVTPPGADASTSVTLPAVLASSLIGGVAGAALALLLNRARRPRRTFLALTVTGLLLSVVSPAMAADDTSTAVWLSVLHLAVAAGVIPPLARALPAQR